MIFSALEANICCLPYNSVDKLPLIAYFHTHTFTHIHTLSLLLYGIKLLERITQS